MAVSLLSRSPLFKAVLMPILVSVSLAGTQLCKAVWATPASPHTVAVAPVPVDAEVLQQMALALVNQDRLGAGLAPMEIDPILAQAAQRHAEDMLRRNYFSHYSPEGSAPSDRLATLGKPLFPAENIAMQKNSRIRRIQFPLLVSFQNQWMSSDGHRRNLMNPRYARFGYGLAFDARSGRAYAVQLFSRF